MANLFEKAKTKTAKKAVEKHEVVNLPGLESSLKEMERINEELAALEAKKALIDVEVRDTAKQAMIDLYNQKKSFPGTLKIKAGEMEFQFITSDRYKKIEEEDYDELKEKYGDEIVEENTVFSFNTAILMKHMDHISDLIMNSKKLSEEDKENLLVTSTSYTVKKGTIKSLFSFKKVKKCVEQIIEDIQPVFSIKAVKKS